MKKLLALILILALSLSLFACSFPSDNTPPANSDGTNNSGDGNPNDNTNNENADGNNSTGENNDNSNPGNADNDNTGSGSTDNGINDSGSTDGGNTGPDSSGSGNTDSGSGDSIGSESSDDTQTPTIQVAKIDGLDEDFIMGVDISSLISLEASGRVFYGFDGKEQDLFKTLSESGVNYIRVRVWNDPFNEDGKGYGGGNCTVDTAIALGKRAAEYGMGLLVDFHYSDFWADPAKQMVPKAWANMTLAQKTQAIYDYTVDSITKIKNNGIKIGMVQIGNETTGGFCGETSKANMYQLMKSAASAVRATDSSILIAVHYTNPENGRYSGYATDLKNYGVDYDVFASSYYPEYHGTIDNLKAQLTNVHNISGKKVMIAETSWSYDIPSYATEAYSYSVQGQTDEIYAVTKAMAELGDMAIGVFYWEPAWIDVPGSNETAKHQLRETFGAGWASSYAGSYDPNDAGKYYGATACMLTSMFDPDGHPLESLKTFLYVRTGTGNNNEENDVVYLDNYISNPSFESNDYSMWKITETNSGTVDFQTKEADAYDGSVTMHFWSSNAVEFTAEQTVKSLPKGSYSFSLYVQGDGAGDDAELLIYVISDGVRYEQTFTLDGWTNWQNPTITDVICNSGSVTVGIKIKAAEGAWGAIDSLSLALNETNPV